MRDFVRQTGKLAIAALREQGAFGTRDGWRCVYANDQGHSCAAGLVFRQLGVSLEVLEEWGGPADMALQSSYYNQYLPERWQTLEADELAYVQVMQIIHDRSARRRGDGTGFLEHIRYTLHSDSNDIRAYPADVVAMVLDDYREVFNEAA